LANKCFIFFYFVKHYYYTINGVVPFWFACAHINLAVGFHSFALRRARKNKRREILLIKQK
jgi:hypothetical protein